MPIQPGRALRSAAHTWILCGKLGNAQIPHVFAAGRVTWVLTKHNSTTPSMRFASSELAIVQTVPGGSITTYLDTLYEFEQRILDKRPAANITLADITRSHEVTEILWRKTPEAVPVILTSAHRDDMSFPFWHVGRALIMSRLQVWIADKKIASALPPPDPDNPNMWDWGRVQNALSTITARVPKFDEADPLAEDVLFDDIATCVGMMPWFGEGDQPSIYEPTHDELIAHDKKQSKLRAEIKRFGQPNT
jgi:hypothetical protein